jgi:hypothetical protein
VGIARSLVERNQQRIDNPIQAQIADDVLPGRSSFPVFSETWI